MRCLSLIILFFIICIDTPAQETSIEDSLKQIIRQKKGDTSEVNALNLLALHQRSADSARAIIQRGIELAKRIHYKKGEAECYLTKTSILYTKDVSETIQSSLSALNISKEINYIPGIISAHGALQGSFREIGDYKNALSHAFEALQTSRVHNVNRVVSIMAGQTVKAAMLAEIAQTYLLMNQLDSAKFYAEKSKLEKDLHYGAEWNFPFYLLATIQNMQGNYRAAIAEYRYAIPLASQNQLFRDTLQIFSGMSTAFRNLGQLDSSLHYASVVIRSENPEREIKTYLEALQSLATGYKMVGNKDSALKYLELSYSYRDSLVGKEKERIIQNITFNEKLKQQEIISDQAKFQSRVQIYVLVGGLFVMLLVTAILWRNNKQKQKANNKIEKAYSELKTTQAQLIQSEKMASLGELTAGIAHEIQNPLNFVNNFSDVNRELLDEAKQEIKTGNIGGVDALLNDIKANEEKINHHGKRADAIVKGMLQHSRTSSDQKEMTDINALVEEYLRLAYHGLRAKDKSFNATTKTAFDESIGKINVVPQEIGRVILNLINNAFYAVNEKNKQNQNGYEPTVSISTKKLSGKIEIKVKDNGNGIPQKILDKIFQPFFTTKPTGLGTGLGLSLAYDIITKGHGGELKVETKVGEGTEFIIHLPSDKTD